MDPPQVSSLYSPLCVFTSRVAVLLVVLPAHISLHHLSRITTILISHFLLYLQEAYQQTVRVNSDDALDFGSNSSTPSFVDRVIGSIGSDIHFAAPEAEDSSDTTGTRLEDTQGDRSDDIGTYAIHSEGQVEDEENADTGITGSSSSVINIGGPAEQEDSEHDGFSHADTAWEDGGEILEVPCTLVVHGCLKNREFP